MTSETGARPQISRAEIDTPDEPVRGFRDGVTDVNYSLARPLRYGLTLSVVCGFGLWHVATNLFWNEPGLWQNAIHFGGFAFLGFITAASFKRHAERPWAICASASTSFSWARARLGVTAASESRSID